MQSKKKVNGQLQNNVILRQLMAMGAPQGKFPVKDKVTKTVRQTELIHDFLQTGGDQVATTDNKSKNQQRRTTTDGSQHNTQQHFYHGQNNDITNGTGTSGTNASGMSGIYHIKNQRPNLRASYNNTNKHSFYPDINQPITSEGRRNVPGAAGGSYQENAQAFNHPSSNSSRMQFKKFQNY